MAKEEVKYYERHDIPVVTTEEAKNHIAFALRNKIHRGVLCLVGHAGSGKTQIVLQTAKEAGYRVCYIRTANFNILSCGVPSTKSAEKGFFELVVPDSLPKPGEKAILFFDEVNHAQQHAIAMFFSLLEDRQLFNYQLPDDCLVIAAMNPHTAQYSVTRIEHNAALRRRLMWLYVIPGFKNWLDHAMSDQFHMTDADALGEAKPCHPDLLSYFRRYPDRLYDQGAFMEEKQFTCPATVQTASLNAYLLEKEGINLMDPFAYTRFAGILGTTTATGIVRFLETINDLIDPTTVVEDYKNAQERVKILVEKGKSDLLGELAGGVNHHLFLSNKQIKTLAKNYVQFLLDLPVELTITALRQLPTIAGENNAKERLSKLTQALTTMDSWKDLKVRLDRMDKELTEAILNVK